MILLTLLISNPFFQERCYHLYLICKNAKGIAFLFVFKKTNKKIQKTQTNNQNVHQINKKSNNKMDSRKYGLC